MSARATAIAVVALLVLGVALIAQAWRMKDYSLNVSIAERAPGTNPEMLRNYHRGRSRPLAQQRRAPS